jgi:hypothetical protein
VECHDTCEKRHGDRASAGEGHHCAVKIPGFLTDGT